MENQVRELLRDMADEVPGDLRAPPRFDERARRRIALTMGMTFVTAVVLAVGAVVGAKSLFSASPQLPTDRRRVPPRPVFENSAPRLFGILDGKVAFEARTWSSPWFQGIVEGDESIVQDVRGASLVVISDPWLPVRPGCSGRPASTKELARWLRGNPELVVTPAKKATVGGVDAVWFDIAPVPGSPNCQQEPYGPIVPVVIAHRNTPESHPTGLEGDQRMRIYLLDLPGEVSRPLAIVVKARTEAFKQAIADASPVLESFEFSSSVRGTLPATPLVAGAWPDVWPQANRADAEAAQAVADAGDSSSWQQDLGFDGVVAERFLKEQLGWAGSLPNGADYFAKGRAGSGWAIDWKFLRCGPEGTNPLYPEDAFAGQCAPTIDQTHFERVEVRTEQLVRRGVGGIWIVTGWARLEPFEQATPTTREERDVALRAIEAFMKARIAGEGAEVFMGSGLDDEARQVLYTMKDGRRFERFEMAVPAPRWVRKDWPNGNDFGSIAVRLFPTTGGGCMVQEVGVGYAGPVDEQGHRFPPQQAYFNTYFVSGTEWREGTNACTAPVDQLNQMLG